MHIRDTLPLTLLVAVAGCSVDLPREGQFGEDEDAICAVVTRTPVGVDDLVTIGTGPDEMEEVRAGDAIAPAAGTHSGALTWEATSETTTITALFGGATNLELVTYEYVGSTNDNGAPLVDPCPMLLEFTVDIELSTDDGRVAEAFTANGWAAAFGISAEAVVDSPSGTIDPVALSTSEEAVDASAIDVHLYVHPTGTPVFGGSISPVLADDPGGDVTVLTGWPGDTVEQ